MEEKSWKTENINTEQIVPESVREILKKKNKKKRTSLIVIIALIAVIGIAFLILNQKGLLPWSKVATVAEPAAQTQYSVTETFYNTTVDLSGSLEANDTQNVNFRVSGACTGVYVKEGDSVTKGQLIAKIDDISYQKNIKQIEANISKAKITGSANELEQLELELQEANNNLEYTMVFANFDGVVSDSSLQVGDYVEKGQTYMTIIDVNSLKATVEIDEIDMQYIELGQKATLSFDGYPEGDLEATVTYIPMVGRTTSSGIGVLDVELTISDPPALLKPGYTFEGEINIEGENSILLVPQKAVTQNRNQSTVQKLNEDGTVSTVTVTTKYLGEGYSQIVSGNIKAGDVIITASESTSEESATAGLGMMMTGVGGGGQGPQMGGGGMPPQMGGN